MDSAARQPKFSRRVLVLPPDVTVAILQCAAREIVILLGEYLFVPVARLSGASRLKDPTERPLF
ncbi:MAG: hypothetical protein ACRDY6_16385 [Acidimicrobiia bacterium]